MEIDDGYWSTAQEFALEHWAVFACSFFDSFDWFQYAYMQPQIAIVIFAGNNMHFATLAHSLTALVGSRTHTCNCKLPQQFSLETTCILPRAGQSRYRRTR